ncbi:hypothetical protein ABT298_04940 [Streptomyces sp. NPDC001034]|uniref:hypothetical protein n=1 Tax=Streptomyces sp. NPDC001034 TaxID=3154375 RepID=UPI00331BD6CC
MAERNGGDGPPGHRHGTLDVEARLGAALRAYEPDPEAEHRAVAAFRTARTPGARPPRTRLRDDWRTPASPRRSLRTALSLALASLTLGGVATAAIGVSGSHRDEQGARRPHPSATATPPVSVAPPSTAPPSTATPPPPAESEPPSAHPATAQDTRAHCQAFEKAARRGHALDAAAWRQLVAAAGGQEKVAAYCAARNADKSGAGEASSTRGSRKK